MLAGTMLTGAQLRMADGAIDRVMSALQPFGVVLTQLPMVLPQDAAQRVASFLAPDVTLAPLMTLGEDQVKGALVPADLPASVLPLLRRRWVAADLPFGRAVVGPGIGTGDDPDLVELRRFAAAIVLGGPDRLPAVDDAIREVVRSLLPGSIETEQDRTFAGTPARVWRLDGRTVAVVQSMPTGLAEDFRIRYVDGENVSRICTVVFVYVSQHGLLAAAPVVDRDPILVDAISEVQQ